MHRKRPYVVLTEHAQGSQRAMKGLHYLPIPQGQLCPSLCTDCPQINKRAQYWLPRALSGQQPAWDCRALISDFSAVLFYQWYCCNGTNKCLSGTQYSIKMVTELFVQFLIVPNRILTNLSHIAFSDIQTDNGIRFRGGQGHPKILQIENVTDLLWTVMHRGGFHIHT